MNTTSHASLPPNSPEDERGLIGCLLLEAEKCLPEFVADFQGSPDQFFDSRHRVVFEAVRELLDAKLPVDVLAVERRLKKTGRIEDAGGVPYLHGLPESSPSVWSLKAFAGEVRDCHLRRRAIQGASEVVRIALDGTAEETANAAERELSAIAMSSAASSDTGVKSAVLDTINQWESIRSGGKKPGLVTGLGMLDVRLRGMHPGQLIVIAGSPGDGKTSLAMQIAEHVAVDCRVPVGVFSLEMTRAELVARMISGRSGVGIEDATGHFDDSSESANRSQALASAAGAISKAPIQINDSCGLTVPQLRAQARLWVQRHGVRLLVIDYLGLVRGTNPKASAYERVSEISTSLKVLAKEIGAPVIALSQLNRSSKKEDRAPDLHDLRDSGSIEQDADVVLMLHSKKPGDTSERSQFTIFIRKHRHARRCELPVIFNRKITRFENDL